MAGCFPCNSFLSTPSTYARHILMTSKFAAFAKKSGDNKQVKSNNGDSNPFQFNWSALSDVSALIPAVSNPSALTVIARRKDAGTVFVAGATGQVGIRIAQMLLREGFRVRAGVSDLGAAQDLARFATDYKIISTEEARRLNAVESMFSDTELLAKAIGNASKVVVTIGSTESGPTTKGVAMSDALQVVEAAQLAGIGHVIIVYDDSASSANTALDSISTFFNNIFSRSQSFSIQEFLDRVVQIDVRYTFIKTSLTDDFSSESPYNVVVAAEGSLGSNGTVGTYDYKVPRLRMASLVASLFSNTEVIENKVVEIYTDPSAPMKSLDELFSVIPEDGRRKAYTEALAKAQAEEEAEKARKAKESTNKRSLEEEGTQSAKQKANEAEITTVDNFINKAKDFSAGFSWDKIGSQLESTVKTADFEPPKVQVATVRGQAKARNLPAQKALVKQTMSKPRPKPAPKAPVVSKVVEEKPDKKVRNIFGGLFKQETIYVEDDD